MPSERAAVAFVVAALVTCVGCSKPAPPTLVPEKAVVTRVDLTGIALDIIVDATNPNSVDLTATGMSSHLVVDKTHDVGTITVPKAITLPAGKTTKLDVPVTMTWSELGLLAQLAASTGAVPYTVDGKLEMGGELLHVGVPFRLEGAITHEQLAGAVMNSLPGLPLPR
jgi:LEA14-like dessication related protein